MQESLQYKYINNHIIILFLEIGNILKTQRKQLRITQPNLADMAEISVNTLYKIERGQANPTLKVLAKLLDLLGMEINLEVKKPL
ncbi:MAG: helix-turn-helix domain-containing protein [Lutibacter sp.]